MFTNTIKLKLTLFYLNKIEQNIILTNTYTVNGWSVSDCVDYEVFLTRHLYTLNLNLNSTNYSKVTITGRINGQGNDEFIFKLNNSNELSIPYSYSCNECSLCGRYTNIYSNVSRTFDVTNYIQEENYIYVYFRNYIGDFSYLINSLSFIITTYSK